MIITIDGPVASGKTSVARALAEELGLFYLYTGMLYRTVALVLSEQKGTDWILQKPTISKEDVSFIEEIEYLYIDHDPIIFFQDRDVTEHLSGPELDQLASIVSSYPVVREALLNIQRLVAKQYDIIADGRDCGSVIFPEAECKFFLTASLEVRAKRVFSDPKRRGTCKSVEEAQKEVATRDERDLNRSAAPLRVPENAETIDNSNFTLQQTVDLFHQKIGKCAAYLERYA